MGEFTLAHFVEDPHTEVSAGDMVAIVEASAVGSMGIETPIACRFDFMNMLAEDKPDVIGKDPENAEEGGGWIAKVTIGEKGIKEFDAMA